MRVWRIADGELLLTLSWRDEVIYVTISPNGQYLAAGCYLDTTVSVFGMNGSLIRMLEGVDSHTGHVNSARFTLDGQSLITASYDETIKLWNHLTGNVLRTFSGHHVTSAIFVFGLAFNADQLIRMLSCWRRLFKTILLSSVAMRAAGSWPGVPRPDRLCFS